MLLSQGCANFTELPRSPFETGDIFFKLPAYKKVNHPALSSSLAEVVGLFLSSSGDGDGTEFYFALRGSDTVNFKF